MNGKEQSTNVKIGSQQPSQPSLQNNNSKDFSWFDGEVNRELLKALAQRVKK